VRPRIDLHTVADSEKATLKRRVDALQKFLHQEKQARVEAEARLQAAEQRASVLATQVGQALTGTS
jgi:hypothetical protein